MAHKYIQFYVLTSIRRLAGRDVWLPLVLVLGVVFFERFRFAALLAVLGVLRLLLCVLLSTFCVDVSLVFSVSVSDAEASSSP
jgi:hypothetical protein